MQAIWAKGYTELLDLVEKDHTTSDMHTTIDCYGYGDDLHEVRHRTSLLLFVEMCSGTCGVERDARMPEQRALQWGPPPSHCPWQASVVL